MNLLQLLLGSLTSNESVNATSKKTGVSSNSISKLMMMAVPLLITYLTKNASKKEGATSLLGALTQHNSTQTVSQQISNADSTDGAKIIAHILGSDQKSVISSLAKETGLTQKEVNSVLNAIAPSLLNSLGTATNATAAKPQSNKVDLSDGIDLSDIAGLLGGGSVSNVNNNPAAGLLGSLLGGSAQQQSSSNTGLDLLGSLLGGNKPTAQQSNGTELLGLLTGLLK
ncbi:MAG: DUF937 domain-containing protein [Erysipelotrichaceae bacterium]|nr:DUF937 domain-containing protein [Erysipelotrichaceae bacterium]MBQ1482003.1 DUF937 domain-containing protein [Erysipelotrichaceae bacterium]